MKLGDIHSHCLFIYTFQSPGESLIATDANLCSVPFPCGLFLPLLLCTLDRIPRMAPLQTTVLSFMRQDQEGNSSLDNIHGPSFLFNSSSIPSQNLMHLPWVHLARWQRLIIYKAERSLNYRQIFVSAESITAV